MVVEGNGDISVLFFARRKYLCNMSNSDEEHLESQVSSFSTLTPVLSTWLQGSLSWGRLFLRLWPPGCVVGSLTNKRVGGK